MFQAVPSTGGRAACQDDVNTFRIMRASQAASWSDKMLESYFDDLKKAEISSRNIFTEKYALMMGSTSPLEYSRIEHLLPPVNRGVFELIEKIVEIIMAWEQELRKKYPYLAAKSRPLYSVDDSTDATSQETYLRGELATYSLNTLQLYLEHIHNQVAEHINGSEITLLHMVKQYGFSSLKEADDSLKFQS